MMTSIDSLIVLLLIAAFAGYSSSLIVTRSYGFGVVGNICVGLLGSSLGGAISPRLGFYTGGSLIGDIVSATAGAVVTLVLIGAGVGALLFTTGLLWRLAASSRA